MSLKQILHNNIKDYGGYMMPYNNIEIICKRTGHKTSYAERELRKSHSPNVETIYNEKGYVKGYRWLGI